MLNQGWIYRDCVDSPGAGLTVLEFYSQRYRHSSRAEWQQRIQAQQIQLNGKPTQAETRLVPGAQLTYHRPPWHEPDVPLEFEVLYEDETIVAIAKPAGLPVLPGGGFLEHTVLHQLQQHFPPPLPFPVHRLGRGTSGLLLLARSPNSRAKLSQQFRRATQQPGQAHQLRKIYRALIAPSDLPDTVTITTPIGKVAHPTLGYVYGATASGKRARTTIHILQRRAASTLVEATIFTGRPHQIRIHLAAAGYPLLGDPLYARGGQPIESLGAAPVIRPSDIGYHLHAHRLTCWHPAAHRPLHLHCPPPPSLTTLS